VIKAIFGNKKRRSQAGFCDCRFLLLKSAKNLKKTCQKGTVYVDKNII
jgi:hypothetical protein